MNVNTKTILIVAGVAIAGYFIYKKIGKTQAVPRPVSSSPGTGNSIPAQTAGGSAGSTSWWNSLGSAASGLSGVVGAVENTYNNAYDYFGGSSGDTSSNQVP